MELVRFKKFVKVIFRIFPRYSVVTHKGISEYQDLSFVGRIGETFRITGHGCIENHLTGNTAFIAE